MNDLKYGKHIIADMSDDYLRNATRSVSLSIVGNERLQNHPEFQSVKAQRAFVADHKQMKADLANLKAEILRRNFVNEMET